jgi:hypothetical protein
MVPEPAHEAEEGDPGDQGAERAGEAGTGSKSGGGRCGGRRPSGPELVDYFGVVGGSAQLLKQGECCGLRFVIETCELR